MNVLLINTHYSGGGAEKVTRQLYYGLKSRGISVRLLVGREKKGTDYTVIYDNPLRAKLLRASTRFIRNVRFHVPLAVHKILHEADRYNIDIIHLNNIHGNYIGIRDIAKLSRKYPVVWTLHDMWAVTGHCAHAFDCTLWIDGQCRPCSNLSMFPELRHDNAAALYHAKSESFTGKNIHFVAPSQWLEKHCRNSFLRGEDISIINNGVDTDLFICHDRKALRKKYRIPQDRHAILFGAAYINSPFKGMRYLIDALNALPHKENYILLIIGNNMDCTQFDRAFQIHSFGYVDNDAQLSEIYSLADVFIMSSMAENFPCSSIEAFASGTPVIAFASGGLAEQIDENTGILVERGSSEALARAITAFFQYDSQKRAQMQETCRKKALDLYSESIMIDRYIDLYKKVLKEK